MKSISSMYVWSAAVCIALSVSHGTVFGADRATLPERKKDSRSVEMTTPGKKESSLEADRAAKEAKLLSIISSGAPASEKAVPCKELAVFGTAKSVPALAALLPNRDLSSWARIALQNIPGPEADKALRDAVGTTQGRLQQGVINSIGMRKDKKAVELLAGKLNDADPEIVSSAAVALGRIGGDDSAKALKTALAKTSPQSSMYVAEGAIRCAEGLLNDKKFAKARNLYDAVLESSVPQHKILEATRGAILARQEKGVPMLLEQLRSHEKGARAIALRTARELPGKSVTKALAAELDRTAPENQTLLMLALAERGDASVLPMVVQKAKTGSSAVRVAAIGVLEKLGNVSSVPTLLAAATSSDRTVAQAAKTALTRLPGAEVDAALVSRLGSAEGYERQTIVELAGKRQIQSALPQIKSLANDSNPAVRKAAFESLGIMGTESDLPVLVSALEKNPDPDIETAILGVAGRAGSAAAPRLVQLAKSSKPELRPVGLRALAAAGGPEALQAVQFAIADTEENVRDEAVRTLASWPNTWPDDKSVAEPLMDLAKNGRKSSHQILALRGYLQFLQGSKDMSPADKVAGIDRALPLMKRPEEKRLAVPILQPLATPQSLELLTNLASDPAVSDDASNAIIRAIKGKPQAFPREAREKALNAIIERSQNDSIKKNAEKLRNET